MIHLHSMLSSETNTPTAGQNRSVPLSQSRLESFHGALSDAVSSTLEKFGIHPSEVKISITRASAISSKPASTTGNTVLRTTPPPPTTGKSSSTSTSSSSTGSTGSKPPNGGYDPFLQASYNNPYKSTSAASTTSNTSNSIAATPNATQAAANSEIAFDNAYWAAQPPAVQALRNMQNPAERTELATQLASEGYSIDVPIMVWGWDPSITTSMREADGYTWVPSANQNPVEMAPGIPSMGGVAAYDPANPPAGSIAV